MSIHFLSSESDPYEEAVQDAIAACDGDLGGALRALIMANEFLEAELRKARTQDAVSIEGVA
jgi:hypothetical protein